MKGSFPKLYLSIVAMPFFMACSSLLVFADEKQSKEAADESIEEVIVTGIRASLESALEAKRAISNLTEVINADDIGKLPDENIAEVLENLPGVQIDRSSGIGSSVSVRGSSQNRVEINGRSTTPAQDERGGISFSDLPSSLVRSLNVVKVPTADMVEGSLGGTINVKTYRGLNLKKPLRVVKVKSEYAQNADRWNENFSATYGNKFQTRNGDVGAIINLSHMDKFVREDTLRVSPTGREKEVGMYDPSGGLDYVPYYKPGFSILDYGMQHLTNSALSGSLEWRADDSIKFYAEATYTDLKKQSLRQQSSVGGYLDSNVELDDTKRTYRAVEVGGQKVFMIESAIVGGGLRDDLSDDGLRIRANNLSGGRETQSYVGTFGGEWDSDSLNIVFELNAAGSYTERVDLKTIFQFNDVDDVGNLLHTSDGYRRVPFYFNITGDILEYGPKVGEVTNKDFVNPNLWSLYQNKIVDIAYRNKEVAQKIDMTWFPNNDFITSIKAGLRHTKRLSEREKQYQLTEDFPGLTAAYFKDYLSETPGDFFSFHESGNYLDNFITIDPDLGLTHRDVIADLVSKSASAVIDPMQGFSVDENTAASYFRVDFDFSGIRVPIKGNIGVRDIYTKQVADGTGNDQIIQKYSHTLPSASLVFSPIEKLQFRVGYAQLLRRPSFSYLSPTVDYPLNSGSAIRFGNKELVPTTGEQFDFGLEYYFRKGSVASIGFYKKNLKNIISLEKNTNGARCNPKLEWTDSYQNWQKCKERDDDDNFVTGDNGELIIIDGIRVTNLTPQNTYKVFDPDTGIETGERKIDRGSLRGVELSFLHYFRGLPQKFKGLGIIASYAYQEGERNKTFNEQSFLIEDGGVARVFPLSPTRLSENSYNFTVFYEKYRLNWRLRYTYRDNFLLSTLSDIASSQPLYTDDRGQLNGSISYMINKTLTATLAGVNLLKSRKTHPGVFPEGPIAQMSDSDRRVSFGLRAKF